MLRRADGALARYFDEARQPHYCVKLVLVGDGHAGKTSTLRMLRAGQACAAAP
jgi:hypothetical protein